MMKLNKVKYSKIAVVVFLTALIWIWADLALNEEYPLPRVTIKMGRSRPSLWISFGGESAVDINDVVLKGPVSKMSELKRIIRNDPQKLEFTLNAEQQGMLDPGEHPQDVSDFIKNIDWIRALGLTVEDCVPDVVDVNVVELEQKDLDVWCLYRDGILREPESIDPQKVSMFVPKDWFGEKLRAFVDLAPVEISRARSEAISKTPYIELATGQRRQATTPVEIKMPFKEDTRITYTIAQPILGFCFSANTQGKYKVEVEKGTLNEVLSITVKATEVAKQAYEDMGYQVILEILDEDIKNAAEGLDIPREVIYNFPDEFVRRDEIELVSPKATATFKLVPVSP